MYCAVNADRTHGFEHDVFYELLNVLVYFHKKHVLVP